MNWGEERREEDVGVEIVQMSHQGELGVGRRRRLYFDLRSLVRASPLAPPLVAPGPYIGATTGPPISRTRCFEVCRARGELW